MSRKWALRLKLMTYGAITFGWVQAYGDVNFGTMFAQILGGFLNRLVNFLLGGDANTLQTVTGLSSLFG